MLSGLAGVYGDCFTLSALLLYSSDTQSWSAEGVCILGLAAASPCQASGFGVLLTLQ